MSTSRKGSKKPKGYIVSNPEYSGINHNLQILRVCITKLETKIDFGYQATDYFTNGGWIKISRHTFIRPKDSRRKYILDNAAYIPYGPEKLHFNSTIEWRYFSLYFPPLPLDVTAIDFIEKDPGTPNDFNFFDIRLDDERKKSLLF
jgi:hypothetical protein